MIKIAFGCFCSTCTCDTFSKGIQRSGCKRKSSTMNPTYKVHSLMNLFSLLKTHIFTNNFNFIGFGECCSFFLVIHEHIWNNRVHLAASISRLRIKNSALSLMELLPPHLQDDKVAVATANPIVTGWINPFKLK